MDPNSPERPAAPGAVMRRSAEELVQIPPLQVLNQQSGRLPQGTESQQARHVMVRDATQRLSLQTQARGGVRRRRAAQRAGGGQAPRAGVQGVRGGPAVDLTHADLRGAG